MPALPSIASASELTKTLGRHVSEVTVEKSFPTVLSHIFRLRLAYEDDAAGAPASLILKAGLLDRPGGPWRPGQYEVTCYRQVAPATPEGLLLRCFAGHADPESGAWHLLLEDLTDSHRIATPWPLPPTFDQCATIIRAQARFHAAWWSDARLGVSIGTRGETSLDAMARRRGGWSVRSRRPSSTATPMRGIASCRLTAARSDCSTGTPGGSTMHRMTSPT
jgi:hypothetical protein